MDYKFNYKIDLPEDLETLLDQDFWILENVNPSMLRTLTEPIKFAANSWIFVRKGICRAEINLISYEIVGPAFVSINSSQILLPSYISDDFDASVIIMSRRFQENLYIFLANTQLYTNYCRHVTVPVPPELIGRFDSFIAELKGILSDKENPYGRQALLFETSTFLFKSLYKCYEPFRDEIMSTQGHMASRFLSLVQTNFRKERFLDFYASKLEVTPKHLSRTVKNQTGFTAVEWIERFVILEAKVLLKSSNLNIQQIADELNFPSQSFFGKYFKKYAGMSPKEFRNT